VGGGLCEQGLEALLDGGGIVERHQLVGQREQAADSSGSRSPTARW
jgi:hypothetical protein